MASNLVEQKGLSPEKQAKVDAILKKYEEKNRQIELEHLKSKGLIGFGGTLQGVSMHPIFNIPYIGTGIGGALYDAGGAIVEGKKLPEIAKQAGRGFIIGETVGAIPYVGKVAGKTKAGQAIAKQAGKAFDYLANTQIGRKVAEIAPKVEDVLMTDIKAYNPFKQTQTAYHGSPYDFKKFSNEAIGTGEGAQAHGMGHYAAKNKDVAQGYADRLSNSLDVWEYDGNKIEKDLDVYQRAKAIGKQQLKEIYNKDLKSAQEQAKNTKIEDDEISKLLFGDYAPDFGKIKLNRIKNKIDLLDTIDVNKINHYKPRGNLYKLSIPKDDVMLREGATLAEQPKLLNRLGMNNADNVKQEMDNLLDYIKNNKSSLPSEELNNLRKQYSDLSYKKMLNDPQLKSEAYYEALADSLGSEQLANEFLLDKGIKGISYNGGIDGEARVIFNPDDIQIVRKYYNQPQAIEYFEKFKPSLGALSSGLDKGKIDTKQWKKYAKENLIGKSVDVPNYTTVHFTNKNLGKDYPYNMPEYLNLAKRLMDSEYAFTTNYNNETDRFYDHLVNNKDDKLFDYLIEVVKDTEGNIHHNYKMMKNINRGDKP